MRLDRLISARCVQRTGNVTRRLRKRTQRWMPASPARFSVDENETHPGNSGRSITQMLMRLPMIVLALPLAFGPAAWSQQAERRIPACSQCRCDGTLIEDNLKALKFCVTRGLRVKRQTGQHGDVHYSITNDLTEVRLSCASLPARSFPGECPTGRRVHHFSNGPAPEASVSKTANLRGRISSLVT